MKTIMAILNMNTPWPVAAVIVILVVILEFGLLPKYHRSVNCSYSILTNQDNCVETVSKTDGWLTEWLKK